MNKIASFKNDMENGLEEDTEQSIEYAEQIRKDMTVPPKISLDLTAGHGDNVYKRPIYSRASDMNVPEHLSVSNVKEPNIPNGEISKPPNLPSKIKPISAFDRSPQLPLSQRIHLLENQIVANHIDINILRDELLRQKRMHIVTLYGLVAIYALTKLISWIRK